MPHYIATCRSVKGNLRLGKARPKAVFAPHSIIMVRRICTVVGLSILVLSTAFGAVQKKESAPQPTTWSDGSGRPVNPLAAKKGHPVVMIFVLTDCPIANSYAPEIKRIVDKYGSHGTEFYIVYEDEGITREAAKKHAKEFGYRCPTLLDPYHTLAKAAGATVSPEAVVVAASRAIVYRGRIDNRAVDFGKMRPHATRHDLRLVLDALGRGRAAPFSQTPCVGCFLPR